MTQTVQTGGPARGAAAQALFRFDEIVSISQVFARSINIKRDFTPEEDAKVAGYVPTAPAEDCLKAVADATQPFAEERVRLVYGPYGGGKSNLGLVIARLMHSGCGYPALQPVLDRIASGPRKYIRQQLTDRWASLEQEGRATYLTVLLHGNEGPFRDAMLAALQHTLAEAGLDDLVPRTTFRAARERIRDWRESHEHAYEQFEALLARENETVAGLEQRLRDFSSEAYDQFCRLHPRVSAGAGFNANELSKAHEVYREVARLLRERGFAGISVIWDEFGSYFEEATRLIRNQGSSAELKDVEQFAEMCHASRTNQVHLLALAHRSLNEYAELAQLNQQAMDEWKRISGRFDSRNLASGARDQDVYEVLGRVVTHEARWDEFLEAGGKEAIGRAATEAVRQGLFNWELDAVTRMARQCYPLHPATAYILPKLSGAIAQNERTLFTYTSYDEVGSMRRFLAAAGGFPATDPTFVPVDALFEYFTPAIQQERRNSWLQYTLTLYEAGGDTIPDADRRILQAMTIWDTVRANVRPLTADGCRFALGCRESDEVAAFDAALARLKGLGVVYQRSDGTLLFAGSDRQSIQTDLDKAIGRLRSTHDPVSFLRDKATQLGSAGLIVNDIEPGEYQAKHKSRRTMRAVVAGPQEEPLLRTKLTQLAVVPDQTEGLICYLVCQTADDIVRAQSAAQGLLKHERVLVVVPSAALDVREHTLRLDALLELRRQSPYSNPQSGQAQMLTDYLATSRRNLETQLRPLFKLSSGGVVSQVWRNGEVVQELREHDALEDYVSRLFAAIYSSNLAIEDENLSTKPASRQAYGAARATRRAVIDRVLRFGTLAPNQRETLGFPETSAHNRYVRSLLKGGGFLSQGIRSWELGKPKGDRYAAGAAVFDEISRYVFDARYEGQERPVRTLVQRLSRPPYGLYSPALGILIAVAIRERSGQLRFYKDGKAIADRSHVLEGIIDEMVYEPAAFSFVNRKVSGELRALVNVLLRAIGQPRLDAEADPVAEGAAALHRWGEGLNPYARRTSRLNAHARALRDLATREDIDPYRIFETELPKALGIDEEVQRCGGDEEKLTASRSVIVEAVAEVEQCHLRIEDQLIEVVCTVFGVASGPPSAVAEALSADLLSKLERADPAARDAVRPVIWDLQSWLEIDHADAGAAFGELALRLVDKRDLREWVDADLETVRAKLAAMREIIRRLPGRPEPPSANQKRFLEMLTAAVGGDAAAVGEAADPLQVAADASQRWYAGLSAYAKESMKLPEDAQTFRDAMRDAQRAPRAVLLQILPRRLNLEDDIATLDTDSAVPRIRLRLNRVVGVVSGAAIKVGEAMADAVRGEFGLSGGDLDQVLGGVRELIEQRLVAAGGTPVPERIARFRSVIQEDQPAPQVFRALGELYVGPKEPHQWSDVDVAHARLEVRRVAGAIALLRPSGPRRVRLMVTVNGNQSAADVMTNESVEMLATGFVERLTDFLRADPLRDEGKAIALATVLQGLIDRQGRRR
jgi:hypothetical protein